MEFELLGNVMSLFEETKQIFLIKLLHLKCFPY